MKILVPVKRVVDYAVRIRIKSDGSGVETDNVKMGLNPFCEIAIEEAMRLHEAGIVQEVVLVSIGSEKTIDTLRAGLAMGAHRAIWVHHDTPLIPLDIAHVLKAIVEREQPECVMLGKQSIDGDNNQTGQMLAALLDWPQATYASKILMTSEQVTVTREVDAGLETIVAPLPAVVTVDLRLNEPRYATLPNIMQAKRKAIETLTVDVLGVTLKEHVSVLKVSAPAPRKGGVMVGSVSELVDKLRHEAKVIK